MKKFRRSAFLALAISLVCAVAGLAQGRSGTETVITPTYNLNSPVSGEVVTGGRQYTIRWDLTVDPSIVQNPYAEMEYYLTTDEGLFMRITPQLDITTKSFVWTVPAINTTTARLTLKCGIEGEGDQYTFTQSAPFTIRKGKKLISLLLLNSFDEEARPGSDLSISWVPGGIDEARGYDVMISYDRGAHFHKAGTTTETRFSYPVDEDFAGSITVQIVARGSDGAKVMSAITREATVNVRRRDK